MNESPRLGQRVFINDSAPYFHGYEAIIAYIGTDGVSVYLANSEFDECICLKWGEYNVKPKEAAHADEG